MDDSASAAFEAALARLKGERQRMFVREYLVDLNATQAAIRAGYSARTAKQQGSRLLTDDDVAAAVAAGQTQRAEKLEITQDYVLEAILETVERCRQAVAPLYDRKGERVMVDDRDGNKAAAFIFDAKNVLAGAKLLGQHLGMFAETHKHEGEINHNHVARVVMVPPKVPAEGSTRPMAEDAD